MRDFVSTRRIKGGGWFWSPQATRIIIFVNALTVTEKIPIPDDFWKFVYFNAWNVGRETRFEFSLDTTLPNVTVPDEEITKFAEYVIFYSTIIMGTR